MKGYLILEDGQIFVGQHIGANVETISEFVFNTSMTGYVEVLSDPSYAGQSVVMTYPIIGNYGVCLDDQESKRPYVEGFIVNELCHFGSNFRKDMDLEDYMKEYGITGIQGIDTRYLTKIIRNKGCMNGLITTTYPKDLDETIQRIKSFRVTGVVEKVTSKEVEVKGNGNTYKVALFDFGAKRNIVNELVKRNCEVTIFPSDTKASMILEGNFDGVMLSNGPGDPSELTSIIEEMKILKDGNIPIFAICLGHQLMALAHGLKTEKLTYGHHGANHPVKDINTNRVYISTQNHNYVVKEDALNETIKPWFKNVNDGTLEGLIYVGENIKTVQFHPEACAGPLDTSYLFDEFIEMMKGAQHV